MTDLSKKYSVALMTPQALANTIRTDGQTRRWFLYLIMQKSVQALCIESDEALTLYAQLRSLILGQRLILWGGVFFVFMALKVMAWPFSLLSALCIVIWFCIHFKLGCVIESISMLFLENYFVEKDVHGKWTSLSVQQGFKEKLAPLTLYGLTEDMARRYQISSLVDNGYRQDKINRVTFLCAFIFFCFIYPSPPLQLIASIVLVYGVVYLMVNSVVFYKYL